MNAENITRIWYGILQLLQSGEKEQAFEKLIPLWIGAVRWVIYSRFNCSTGVAEEAPNEVFLHLWKKEPSYWKQIGQDQRSDEVDEEELARQFRALLWTITRNRVFDFMVRERVIRRAHFTLTELSLCSLREAGLPDEVSKQLQSLVDQRFNAKNKFLKAVERAIGKAQTDLHEELIVEHAMHRSHHEDAPRPAAPPPDDQELFCHACRVRGEQAFKAWTFKQHSKDEAEQIMKMLWQHFIEGQTYRAIAYYWTIRGKEITFQMVGYHVNTFRDFMKAYIATHCEGCH